MGGLRKTFPVVFACVTIASLSLTGAAFLSGFYSKDLIIEFGLSRYQIPAMFIYWLTNTSAALTAFYS
jgi:NADH:ubiquinone oxidoreductase subunit 5 (subunit L)/multisubunit Na+/H+ antiporter MnhA subunit